KGKNQDRGKPYDNKGKKQDGSGSGKKDMKCLKCGRWGHKTEECRNPDAKCFKCGRKIGS
ncbi:hypothetical protein A2U01_0091261, partial [Trifolium medium]|nr:hypothetical protein [Trifolium medium]